MVSVRNISVLFGSFELLTDVSFLINSQDRIGLAGKNGSGKTTLLRIIAGIQSPTSGQVDLPRDFSIGYLPQQMKVNDTTTVMNEAIGAFSELTALSDEIERCTGEVAQREDYETEEYLKLCDHLTFIEERYRMLGGINYLAETEKTLTGLGFDRKDFDKPTVELSGGWRMRVELAKILLRKPALFLLDEPTNHLDIESIQWIESFLAGYPGAVVLVSHDRAFLDNVTTRTIEISLGKIYDYKVPYSRFIELRKERREQQIAAFRNQQKMIGDTERFIERFRYKATKSIQVQSKIKKLNKVDRLEVDEEDNSSINIRFAPAPRSGSVVVEILDLSKSYGALQVLKNIDFTIERGEKIAFVGRNGEGKTTFSRIIVGESDYSGIVKRGHNLKTGYFAQNQDELLDENKTVLQTIDEIAKGEIRTRIRDMLGAFLFRGEDIDKKVKVLSGGERSRLALIKLLLEPYNLLVLDEPTNHLDMRSKDILKQALIKYDGTLIVVSHDRDFLDGLVNKVYEFRNNKIKEHIGGIYNFLRKKKIENLKELEIREKSPGDTSSPENISENKRKYIEKKEYDRNMRRLVKRVEEIETEIERIEAEVAEMDRTLSEPDHLLPPEEGFFNRYIDLKKSLNNKIASWGEYTSELEDLKKINE
jgi:ATP-binding cassette subfamily F protein 3